VPQHIHATCHATSRWLVPRKVGNNILWLNCRYAITPTTLRPPIDKPLSPFAMQTVLIHINGIESLLLSPARHSLLSPTCHRATPSIVCCIQFMRYDGHKHTHTHMYECALRINKDVLVNLKYKYKKIKTK